MKTKYIAYPNLTRTRKGVLGTLRLPQPTEDEIKDVGDASITPTYRDRDLGCWGRFAYPNLLRSRSVKRRSRLSREGIANIRWVVGVVSKLPGFRSGHASHPTASREDPHPVGTDGEAPVEAPAAGSLHRILPGRVRAPAFD